MWFWISLLAIGVIIIVLSFCVKMPSAPQSLAGEILQGEHKLRKMAERADVHSKSFAAFFLFAGGYSGKSTTDVSVKFAWQMNDGVYALSSLPLEKIRIKFDEEAGSPTIKFRWTPWHGGRIPQVQELMDQNVLYAVLTVREGDWPADINLPLAAAVKEA